MKVVATLSSWTFAAAIVRDTYYYADDGGFGDSVHVVKDIHTANPVQEQDQAAPAPTGNGRHKTRPTSTEAATAHRARPSTSRTTETDASIPSGRAGTDGCADAD